MPARARQASAIGIAPPTATRSPVAAAHTAQMTMRSDLGPDASAGRRRAPSAVSPPGVCGRVGVLMMLGNHDVIHGPHIGGTGLR